MKTFSLQISFEGRATLLHETIIRQVGCTTTTTFCVGVASYQQKQRCAFVRRYRRSLLHLSSLTQRFAVARFYTRAPFFAQHRIIGLMAYNENATCTEKALARELVKNSSSSVRWFEMPPKKKRKATRCVHIKLFYEHFFSTPAAGNCLAFHLGSHGARSWQGRSSR